MRVFYFLGAEQIVLYPKPNSCFDPQSMFSTYVSAFSQKNIQRDFLACHDPIMATVIPAPV